MKDLRLMVKGLVAGIRTLSLAFTLLLSVLYVISGFATYTIGREATDASPDLDVQPFFRNLPVQLVRSQLKILSSARAMFTAFRCFTGECTNDLGAWESCK